MAKKRQRNPPPNERDYHHIFYQRRHYDRYWAKRLREHHYAGALVPRETLHRQIHDKIHDVPTPNEDVCEWLWHELTALADDGIIDVKHDHLEQRLTTIIELLREYDAEQLDATIAILRWQWQIVHKFYTNGH